MVSVDAALAKSYLCSLRQVRRTRLPLYGVLEQQHASLTCGDVAELVTTDAGAVTGAGPDVLTPLRVTELVTWHRAQLQ